MLPEKIIFVGLLLSLPALFLYIKDIFRGRNRPNLVSWFVWMLAPFIGVFFQLKAGAGWSVLPVFMAGFFPLLVIIFSLSYKNAYWKITTFDIICGIFSLFALMLYLFTHNLEISVLFAILSDGLAAIPTIIKSWKFPETETSGVYLVGILNNILALLTIKNWIFSIYSFSIYFIIINSIIVFAILRKKFIF
jgi:hypothetical protein